MKAYTVTTGIVFAAMVLLHVLRVIQEGTHLLKEPFFIVITLASAALAVWAGWLVSATAKRAG